MYHDQSAQRTSHGDGQGDRLQIPQVPVVLIGPMCAGKSTVAQLLSGQLHLPRYELDELRWDYYAEIGYDPAALAPLVQAEGIGGVLRYWKPFEAHAVERVLTEKRDGVIDFGAGHSVYEDAALFGRVQRALAPLPNVFLLLPSPDIEASIAVLNERLIALLKKEFGTVDPDSLDMNAHFVTHPSNRSLAKHVVFTDGETPEETCKRILALLAC